MIYCSSLKCDIGLYILLKLECVMPWSRFALFECSVIRATASYSMFYCGYVMCTVCTEATCRPGYFNCRDGQCIRERFVCDGYNDCNNAADEENCA